MTYQQLLQYTTVWIWAVFFGYKTARYTTLDLIRQFQKPSKTAWATIAAANVLIYSATFETASLIALRIVNG